MRLRPSVATLLLTALALTGPAGCGTDGSGGQPAGDGDPSRSAPGVDLDLDARVATGDGTLTVRYRATNEGDEALLLFDHLARPSGAGSRLTTEEWATLDAGDGVAEIAQRAVAPPEGEEMPSLDSLGATDLEPGEAVEATVEVPLPLRARGPYADRGQGPPSDARQVRFCLGAAREDPDAGLVARRTGVPDGVDAAVAHGRAWAEAQAVVCTDPVDLP